MLRALLAEELVMIRSPVVLVGFIRCELRGAGWSGLPLLRTLTIRYSSLNLRAFFVVIPGSDQKKWHGVLGIVKLMEYFQRVLKCRAAASVHMPVQAP
jgi:hypothetical protein